jgi:hypothetical protein
MHTKILKLVCLHNDIWHVLSNHLISVYLCAFVWPCCCIYSINVRIMDHIKFLNVYAHLHFLHACYMSCEFHSPLLKYPEISGEGFKLWSKPLVTTMSPFLLRSSSYLVLFSNIPQCVFFMYSHKTDCAEQKASFWSATFSNIGRVLKTWYCRTGTL